MSLDIFDREAQETISFAGRHSASDLPATYSETFQASWRHASVFGNSVAGDQARVEAFFDYADEYSKRTGGKNVFPATLNTIGGYQGALDSFNEQVRKTAAERPDLNLAELTEKDIEDRATQIGGRARSEFERMQQREKTAGGTFGNIMGGLSGAMTDPVNLITFPLAAPESLGIIGTTLAWGGIAGGTQAAIELIGNDFRDKVDPGYSSRGEPAANILTASVFGGALGGTFKGAAMAWQRYKTGSWPRTIRDAGNVVESEANIESGNRFPGVEGEVIHRNALNKAIDDLANGRPVDVDSIVPPEQFASREAALDPVIAARDASAEAQAAERAATEEALAAGKPQPDLPFAQTEAAALAEARGATLTEGIQNIARMAGHDMPAEEAARIAARVTQLSDPEKARALLDEVFVRPQTIADTLPAAESQSRGPAAARRAVLEASPATTDEILARARQDFERSGATHDTTYNARMIGENFGPDARARYETEIERLNRESVEAYRRQRSPSQESAAALRDDLAPARIEELRTETEVAETMARDLDKLVAERPDLEIPTAVEIGPDGKPVSVMRKVDSAIAEVEQRELAAKELMSCVGPYPAEAA